ncbi:LysM peptidoglycan-binding domain-containing protein [Pontivivens ytuae]|uniref:LysM peptidoglycan-binding domain-containing protein n=1 Tax=Pontivivens ytuae TaxID=2789856 RepID=A0A7S9LQ68_9RHOB|nr:LysM domain-containing protein [Pontivivens ytuae]QPH53282.1 LysM peptidoglycan-binding domain-containing protein [Pontivivens ytuae]
MTFSAARTAAILAALPLSAAAQAPELGPCGYFEAVEPNDTFSIIAQRCEVPVEQVLDANSTRDPRDLDIGSVVIIVERPDIQVSTSPRARSEEDLAAARTAAAERFTALRGVYAIEGGSCEGVEETWSLAPEQIRAQTDICDISDFGPVQGRIDVNVVCRSDQAARTFTFESAAPGILTLSAPQQSETLTRCRGVATAEE